MRKIILMIAVMSAAVSTTAQTGSLVREDRVWEYIGDMGNSDVVAFTYKMRFEGTKILDGKEYHILHTTDGREYKYAGANTDFEVVELGDGHSFLIREEDGKVYVHSPVESFDGFEYWNGDDTEALLYDFNAKEGDSMTVVGSCGGLINGNVTSTFTENINGEDCLAYTIRLDIYGMDITVIEGIGNISFGCIPYYIEDEIAGGGSLSGDGSIAALPAPMRSQKLLRVTDLDGNVIYEPNENTPDGVESVVADCGLRYDGNAIISRDSDIVVYGLSGKVVAEGHGTVTTSGMYPGIYVARAGGKSLKIIVRN